MPYLNWDQLYPHHPALGPWHELLDQQSEVAIIPMEDETLLFCFVLLPNLAQTTSVTRWQKIHETIVVPKKLIIRIPIAKRPWRWASTERGNYGTRWIRPCPTSPCLAAFPGPRPSLSSRPESCCRRRPLLHLRADSEEGERRGGGAFLLLWMKQCNTMHLCSCFPVDSYRLPT